MKIKFLISTIVLSVFMASCHKNEPTGFVKFSLNLPSIKNVNLTSINFDIDDANGNIVCFDKKISIRKDSIIFTSNLIEIPVGANKLTKFQVLDDKDSVCFIVPYNTSNNSDSIATKLPFAFNLKNDQALTIPVECISAADSNSTYKKKALNVKLKDINGNQGYILPDNNLKTILFTGGKNTKDDKITWYEQIISQCKDFQFNSIILLQLSDVSSLIPRSYVEKEAKKQMEDMKTQYGYNDQTYGFFDWGKELQNFYNTDINNVALVIIDEQDYIIDIIKDKYSDENMNKIKTYLSQ